MFARLVASPVYIGPVVFISLVLVVLLCRVLVSNGTFTVCLSRLDAWIVPGVSCCFPRGRAVVLGASRRLVVLAFGFSAVFDVSGGAVAPFFFPRFFW